MRGLFLIIFGFLEFLIRVPVGVMLLFGSIFLILLLVDFEDIFVPYLWREL